VVDDEQDEPLARYTRLAEQAEALQKEMNRRNRTPWGVLVKRWLVLVGGAVALFGGGWWMARGWGLAGAAAVPVVAFFGWVFVPLLVRGEAKVLGELRIDADEEAKVVRFCSTLEDPLLPVALLAQLDRWMIRYSHRSHLTARQSTFLAALRAKLDAPVQGIWRAEQGAAQAPLVIVRRDRLGLTYSMVSWTGLGPRNPGDLPEVCLALIDFGLSRPDRDRLTAALRLYCDEVERKGRSPGALRRAGKLLL
jgi:hypothetical protein